MGGTQSNVNQSNTQNVLNDINQTSNEKCSNTCFSSSDTNIVIDNSTLKGKGGIDLAFGCVLTDASCVQKAALTSQLTNSLISQESSSIKAGSDPFPTFTSTSNNVNQNSYQTVANTVSQNVNAVCQNSSVVNSDININITNSIVDAPITTKTIADNSKPSCTMNNSASSIVQNQLSSTMKSTITGVQCLSIFQAIFVTLILAIGGCVMIGVAGASGAIIEHEKNHGKKKVAKINQQTALDIAQINASLGKASDTSVGTSTPKSTPTKKSTPKSTPTKKS